MAVLPALDRDRVKRYFMRQGQRVGPCTFTKVDLTAAVDATDAWIESNQTSFNNALPVGFRNAATLDQKTLLFCWVALRRAGLLTVEEDS